MKSFTALAAFAALASAATVTLKETPCLQNNTQLEEFTIDTDKLVVKELKSVCGLALVSASGVDITTLTCQAFKDTEGKILGSAEFTSKTPALIATNPVQEGSIICKSSGGDSASLSSTTFTTMAVSMTSGAAVSSGTVLPSQSGNSTVPTATRAPTASPSATTTGATAPTGAASRLGLGAGVVAAAFAVLLL